jgi:hypothetical protein
MKRAIPLFGLLLLSIGAVLGGIALALTNPNSEPTIGAPVKVATKQIDVGDAENIPVYPSAQAVEITGEPQLERELKFRTTDSAESVLMFYRDTLPKQGWTLLIDSNYPMYQWRDPQGVAAWGLHLYISIERLIGGENLVDVRLGRWPEEGKAPLYSGAEQVEVHETENKDALPLRVTEYLVKATPQAVEDYYKSVLQEQGWTFEVNESKPISEEPGLLFRTLYGKGRNLSIVAQADKDGDTRVTMELLEYQVGLPHP